MLRYVLIVAGLALGACGSSSAERVYECAAEALRAAADTKPGRQDPGSLVLVVRDQAPRALVPVAIASAEGSIALQAATCGVAGADAALESTRLAISTRCHTTVALERTGELCTLLLNQRGGLGYVIESD